MRESEGAAIVLLAGESCEMRTAHGTETLVAGCGRKSILAAVRPDTGGRLWLGSWRLLGCRESLEGLSLSGGVLFSDRLCRKVAASGDARVLRVRQTFGGVALFPDEALVSGKRMPLYIMPAEWTGGRRKETIRCP